MVGKGDRMTGTGDSKPARKARKRADGEGSIRWNETRKLFVARIMVGYRPDGKPDVREVKSKKKGECCKKLHAIKARMSDGSLGDAKSGRETVTAYLDWWLTSIEETMDAESLRRHRDGVKRMKPLIGRHKVADLRPEHVVSMLATLRTTTYTRRKAGQARTLSPRTIRYCFVTLRKALDTALKDGAVARTVARVIEAPVVPKVEVVAHQTDDMGRVMETFATSDDRLAPLYTLAVFTGCRRGELLGLKWSDIDFEAGLLTIRRTLRGAKDGKPDFREGGKTARSVRTFKLPPDALAALQVQEDRQTFERQALGEDYSDHRFVFATPTGTPLDRNNVTKRLGRTLKAAGIPTARPFHTMRHANATMSLLARVDLKTTADRLGHHSPAFTLSRYTHAVRALDEDAADRIQDAFRQARKKASEAS
jgi:integrase